VLNIRGFCPSVPSMIGPCGGGLARLSVDVRRTALPRSYERTRFQGWCSLGGILFRDPLRPEPPLFGLLRQSKKAGLLLHESGASGAAAIRLAPNRLCFTLPGCLSPRRLYLPLRVTTDSRLLLRSLTATHVEACSVRRPRQGVLWFGVKPPPRRQIFPNNYFYRLSHRALDL